ncbi:MAG TPA: Fur family transcriptional regulator [Anaerolineales bacterium]|nr:Fur family transcriptional regulator [Anaerolineales bacterium]
MSCAALYAPQLRASGFRMTSQRMAILHVLHHSGTHLSPTEIYKRARRQAPGLTEPTVYRTLEFLARNQVVMPAHVGGGKLVYEIAGRSHHHLICQFCGSSFEVKPEALEPMIRQLEESSGYRSINSHVTFFGSCPKCQKKEAEDLL